MEEDLDQLVDKLGAVLAAPDLPRLQRNEPGLDKKWAAGDLAARIPRSQLDKVAERLGVGVGQLRSYAEVARAYPPEERTVKAAWTIYREVRILPPEKRKEVLVDGLTLRRARVAIGKGPMDRQKKELQSDEDRASFVLEELQEPGVKAIVEREIASSSVDRKVRRTAKTTLDEIAAQKKFIEGELRKLAKEGTPDRQYWQASKELVGAEQYIYSVARLHHLHRDTVDEERWTDLVKKLRHVADSAQDVADRIEGLAAGDFIEGEEVFEYLELSSGNAEIVDAEIVGDSS